MALDSMPTRSFGTSPALSGPGFTGRAGGGSRVAVRVSVAAAESGTGASDPAGKAGASGPTDAAAASPGGAGLRLGRGGRAATGGSGMTATISAWGAGAGWFAVEQPTTPAVNASTIKEPPTALKERRDLNANGGTSSARGRKISSRSASSSCSLSGLSIGHSTRRFCRSASVPYRTPIGAGSPSSFCRRCWAAVNASVDAQKEVRHAKPLLFWR
jgi:hypothetical protein